MRSRSKNRVFLVISMLICMSLTGCPPKPGDTPVITGFDDIEDSITVVITTETELILSFIPDCGTPFVYPKESVLTYWADGVLLDIAEGVEWLDFDSETCEMVNNPGVDLTRFETPVGVDPEREILYMLGHTVPPLRGVEAHYLDGREFDNIGSTTADEVEMLDPLPMNGWPIFWVDRPGQAGTNLLEDNPTRKLRVYGESSIGGEFYDVTDYFLLEDGVILNRWEDGWVLFELQNGTVRQRTMSLDQIPGELCPLARDRDEILLVSDEGNDPTNSVLYSYGAYTRAVREIWRPDELIGNVKIHALTVSESGNYYLITDAAENSTHEFIVVQFKDGNASIVGQIKSPSLPESINLFVKKPVVEISSEIDDPEPVQGSISESD